MAGDVLILDTIVFEDFAIPNSIALGMGQMLGVQKLIGGDRVLDAMGPDPEPIAWQGRFRGPNASDNSEACRSLAASGNQVGVTWGSNVYQGVITKYHVDYEAYFEVRYSIELTVLPDSSFIGTVATTIDSLVGADLSTAMGLIGSFF